MILRVIAVENVINDPAIACIYKDETLYVYDTFGNFYYQKEFFENIESLDQLIMKGKYTWTDFNIKKGQTISKDYHDEILVDGKEITPIESLNVEQPSITDVTVKLYYEFLKAFYRKDSDMLAGMKNSYDNGLFKTEILDLVADSMYDGLNDFDRKLVVRTRIEGVNFIIDYVKQKLRGLDHYRFDEVQYLFSRLFQLENQGYLQLTLR